MQKTMETFKFFFFRTQFAYFKMSGKKEASEHVFVNAV